MFNIINENFGEFTVVTLHNRNTKSKFTIVPKLGGLVNNWEIPIQGKTFGILDNYSSGDDLYKNHQISYKGARLLPFPNRIAGGSYSFDGKQYQLPINFKSENHAAHGFMSSINLQLIEEIKGNDFARVNFLGNYLGDTNGYPFPFKVELNFELQNRNLLEIRVKVTNTGRERMPFGDGWHPYFKTGSKVDHLKLQIKSEYALEVDKSMIPTGGKINLEKFSNISEIEGQVFDTCFKNILGKVTIIDEAKELEAIFWQETGQDQFQYSQLYTPENRESISIEPVTCEPNAFNTGKGIIIIEPNHSIHLRHGVQINQ